MKTVLVIEGRIRPGSDEYDVVEQVHLELGDTCIIQSDGPNLVGDAALQWQIGQLEAQLDRAHAQIGELRTLAGDVARARTMDDVFAALVRYGTLDELLLLNSPDRGIFSRNVRRAWNTLRRRPTGQA